MHDRQTRYGNVFRLERVNRMSTRQSIRHHLPNLLNNTSEMMINSMNTISLLSLKKELKNSISVNTLKNAINLIATFATGSNLT